MSERDEMCKLINPIEKDTAGASVERNFEDLKLFANTASFLVNKIDARLTQKAKQQKTKLLKRAVPQPYIRKPHSPNEPDNIGKTDKPKVPQASTASAKNRALSNTGLENARIAESQKILLLSLLKVNTKYRKVKREIFTVLIT